MTLPTDPLIDTGTLADALGIDRQTIQKSQRAGYVPRPRPGSAPLLAALRGLLAARRAEVADARPYRLPTTPQAPSSSTVDLTLDTMLTDLDRALRPIRRRSIPNPKSKQAVAAALDGVTRRARAYRRNVTAVVMSEG